MTRRETDCFSFARSRTLSNRYIVGTFGVPVEEHLKESEVQQMDGYVSVGMLTGKTIPDTGLD